MQHHPSADIGPWLAQCAQLTHAEGLLRFIRQVQTEVATQVLPAYQRACRTIEDSYHKGSMSRTDSSRRKLALSQEDIFLYQQARAERAQTQQQLQVLVPALRVARALYNQAKCSRLHPAERSALALLLLSFARRTPRQALRSFALETHRLRSTLHFSFEALTPIHAQVARRLLSDFPELFGEAAVESKDDNRQVVVLDRLRRKIVGSVVLSEPERAALDKVFSQAIGTRA